VVSETIKDYTTTPLKIKDMTASYLEYYGDTRGDEELT
jgi:hypothetical protein